MDLWRRPSHLFHKDYLLKAVLFGQQSTNLVLITFIYLAFVEQDDRFFFVRNNILLKGQGHMSSSHGKSPFSRCRLSEVLREVGVMMPQNLQL